MKRFLYILSLFLFLGLAPITLAYSITQSTVLSAASTQFWNILNASQTGLNPAGTANFSISMWVFITTDIAVNGDYYGLVNKDDGGSGTSRQWEWLYYNPSGTRQIYLNVFGVCSGNANYIQATWNQNLGTNTWHMLTITYDGTLTGASNQLKFYLDGTLQTVTTSQTAGTGAATVCSGTAPFDIGRAQDGPKYFNGRISDVRYWGRTLSSTEVSNLNTSPCTFANGSNLGGWWIFNGDGTDNSGNANTLTNNGAATFTASTPYANCTVTTTTNPFIGLVRAFWLH